MSTASSPFATPAPPAPPAPPATPAPPAPPAPPRSIMTDPDLYLQGKTMVVLPAGEPTAPYARKWATVTAIQSADDLLPGHGDAPVPDCAVLLAIPARLSYAAPASTKTVYFAPRRIIEALAGARKRTPAYDAFLNQTPIVPLDECHTMFPFVGPQWDGTADDAAAIAAILTRQRRLIGWPGGPRAATLAALGIEWSAETKRPPPLWLFVQYFESPSQSRTRRQEYRAALQKNLACEQVDRVVLLTEGDLLASVEKLAGGRYAAKLRQRVIGHRITYADFLAFVAGEEVPEDCICVLANADISLDDGTTDFLWQIRLRGRPDTLLALLRWERPPAGTGGGKDPQPFGAGPGTKGRPDSQDAWVVAAASVKARPAGWWGNMAYALGTGGCDNAFAGDMFRHGFFVANPAYSVKTHHHHDAPPGPRPWQTQAPVQAPLYLYVAPTTASDMQIVRALPGAPAVTLRQTCPDPLALVPRCTRPEGANIFATMVKQGKNPLESAPAPSVVFHRLGAAESPGGYMTNSRGVLLDWGRIYIGRDNVVAGAVWEDAVADYLTPPGCSRSGLPVLVLPVERKSTYENIYAYILHAFAKIARIKGELGDQPLLYWAYPDAEKFQDLSVLFELSEAFRSCIAYSEPSKLLYNREVVAALPARMEVSAEDVEALRGLYRRGEGAVTTGGLVVLCGGAIREGCFEQPATYITEETPFFDRFDAVSAAETIVLCGGKQCGDAAHWGYLWAAARGTRVVEFQLETQISPAFQAFAAAAGLDAWVQILHRGGADQQVAQMREALGEILRT